MNIIAIIAIIVYIIEAMTSFHSPAIVIIITISIKH